MRIQKSTLAVVAATGLLVLTGCGGSDDTADSGSNSPAPTTSEASAPEATPKSPDEETSKSPEKPDESEETAEPVVITIADYEYSGPDSVAPGAEVTVENEDDVAHTVTVDEGSDFDVNVDGGSSATFTAPDASGDYPFHCTYHGNMTATLVVK